MSSRLADLVLILCPDIRIRAEQREVILQCSRGVNTYFSALGTVLVCDLLLAFIPELRSRKHAGADLLEKIGRITYNRNVVGFVDLQPDFAEQLQKFGATPPCSVYAKYIINTWRFCRSDARPRLHLSGDYRNQTVFVLPCGLEMIISNQTGNMQLRNRSTGEKRDVINCAFPCNDYGQPCPDFHSMLQANLSMCTEEYALLRLF